MTMPHERLRALIWAGQMLNELAHPGDATKKDWGSAVPETVRRMSLTILRHYPEKHELLWAAKVDRSEMRWLGLDPFENKDPGDEKNEDAI